MALMTLEPPKTAPVTLDFARGFWRLADPKISLASMAAMFLGACLAAHDGPIFWPWLALTVAGIFAIEVAKNASGEIFDFDSGTDLAVAEEDRSPFSGGKRVLVDGLLTRHQTAWIAGIGYAVGIAAGLAIVFLREPRVIAIGLVGVAMAWFYHAPPLKLSYRGLGELAVGVVYGPLIVAGTYLVQRGTVGLAAVAASIPLGTAIASFLIVNEFPDYVADLGAGKRNLVVRLGRRRAAVFFAFMVAVTAIGLGVLPLAGLPIGAWFGGVALVPAIRAAVILRRHPETTSKIIPAQALTLAALVVLAAGVGVGLWVR
jgi:1,4-dihydroxy-2-naphthoate octaprenyltransferase